MAVVAVVPAVVVLLPACRTTAVATPFWPPNQCLEDATRISKAVLQPMIILRITSNLAKLIFTLSQ